MLTIKWLAAVAPEVNLRNLLHTSMQATDPPWILLGDGWSTVIIRGLVPGVGSDWGFM